MGYIFFFPTQCEKNKMFSCKEAGNVRKRTARGLFFWELLQSGAKHEEAERREKVLTLRNDVSLSPLGGSRPESDTNLDGIYLRAPHKQELAEGAG